MIWKFEIHWFIRGPFGNWLVFTVPYVWMFCGTYIRQLRLGIVKTLFISMIWILIMRLAYSGNPGDEVMAALLLAVPSCFVLGLVSASFFMYDDIVREARLIEYCMDMMKIACKGHPIAQAMLIGFCFSFIMEGMTSFGAAAKTITPVLVQLGFS